MSWRQRLSDERAQAFPLAILTLVIGALLVGNFLTYMSTSLISARVYNRAAAAQYAAGSGVDDAIWRLQYDGLGSSLAEAGDSLSYSPGEAVNGAIASVDVTRDMEILAGEDFEGGGWSGGSGWDGDWYYGGAASVTTSGTPYAGRYHLLLTSGTGYVRRSLAVGAHGADRLQFRAKLSSFESGEQARLLLSSNGTDWTRARTWVDGEDDGVYHWYSFDVSAYAPVLWVAFEAAMSASNDYFYLDDLRVVNLFPDAMGAQPADGFESGNFRGGDGWATSYWVTSGTVVTSTGDSPAEGRYHVRLNGRNAYIRRAADLSSGAGVHLTFQGKIRSLEAGNTAELRVSSDGSTWTTLKTWTSADPNNVYQSLDYDLSLYAFTAQFWIEFRTGSTNDSSDYFWVDDVHVTGATAYEIASVAAGRTVKATALDEGASFTITSWENV